MANQNVLSTNSLARNAQASLPQDASPQIKTPLDALALLTHAAMLATGFRLLGLGEDHKIEVEQTEPGQVRPLPAEWNASPGNYAFRYAHVQSSMEYLVKINRMGNKAVIMGMGMGDDKTASFDVKVDDYVSPSSLPATPSSTGSTEEAQKKIIDIFISDGRVADFGGLTRLNIIQKLMPGLRKEGYEETTNQQDSGAATAGHGSVPRAPRSDPDPLRDEPRPARPHPLADPLAQPPRPPMPQGDFPPPGFEDPYDLNRPLRPMGGGIGAPGYGHRDLYPQGLGPNDPFRNIGPGLGGGGGGGMHPTFDDPMFGGQRGGEFGYDPQAPPGARYDPVGPGGRPPRGGPGGFPGGGGIGGRPPNPFGGFGGGDFI